MSYFAISMTIHIHWFLHLINRKFHSHCVLLQQRGIGWAFGGSEVAGRYELICYQCTMHMLLH